MRRGTLAACIAALGWIGAAEVAAQDAVWNRYTLEGLDGFFLRAEADDVCEGLGVSAATALANAAAQLEEAEVGLLDEQEMLAHPGLPELRITIQCAAGSPGPSQALAYSVGLRVQQAAQMIRDSQITLPEAVTWHSTEVGIVEATGAVSALERMLSERLEAFVEAYADANAPEEEEDEAR